MKIIFSPLALDNLQHIQTYIASDNIAAAIRVGAEIKRSIEMLPIHPYMGPVFDAPVRRLVIPRFPYVVFYEVDMAAKQINILTIQHMHQLIPDFSGHG